MVQGCTSDAGKSYLVAGLCRLYANRGVKVAPFKAQNMSNNAGVTPEGLEMGRAQLLQAQAARVSPEARMNPVLLKPEADTRSQVVVLGKARHDLRDVPWLERKPHLWGSVQESLHSLTADYDLVLVEGAGSPAEVNLKESDIVNMRVAKEVGARVLLAADIDRGGAFAHLLGTWHCLDEDEKASLAGFILNKFRGDPALLGDGLNWLEQRTRVPTVGVVPMLRSPLPEEDAFSLKPEAVSNDKPRVAILKTPYLSNFDEFGALLHEEGVQTRFVHGVDDLRKADAVILGGSKHVAADLDFLRRTGLADEVAHLAKLGVPILGVCGGLQMLGHAVHDPGGVEATGSAKGLGLLDVETVFAADKVTRQTTARLLPTGDMLTGYEIHHGRTRAGEGARPLLSDGLGFIQGSVMGVYAHGLFDNTAFRQWFLSNIGVQASNRSWLEHVDNTLDTLAEHLERHLDVDAIDRALGPQTTPSQKSSATFYFITGGARSGKSRYAEALAAHLGRDDVTVIATLEPLDDEMRRRIAKHKLQRPAPWRTLETPLALSQTVLQAPTQTVLIDCLSGFVSNLLLKHEAEGEQVALDRVSGAVDALIRTVKQGRKTVIMVSNEVGGGVVPAYPLGRWYRDALGLANQRVAAAADAVSLLTVGLPRSLKGSLPVLVE